MELTSIASRIAGISNPVISRIASRLSMPTKIKRVVGRVTVPARVTIDVSNDDAFDRAMSVYSSFIPTH